MDRGVVEGEAVGESLDGAGLQEREPPLVEGGGDLPQLPLLQEAEAARLGDQVEGERALGRGETRRIEDPASMEPAVEGDLGDGPLPGEEPNVMDPGVADGEGTVTGWAFLLLWLVSYRGEGPGFTRYEERDAGGGGCSGNPLDEDGREGRSRGPEVSPSSR